MSEELPGLENISFSSTATYTFLEELGRGGMGIVYLAQRTTEGVTEEVVLKSIRTISPRDAEMLKKEANLATQLRHENIVRTFGLESLPFSSLPDAFRREITGLTYDREDFSRLYRRSRLQKYTRGAVAGRHTPIRADAAHGKAGDPRLYLMVMDYVEGLDLHHLHREHVRRGFLLPAPLAAFTISRICRALAYAHESIVHRDISPENILINHQGVCKLSDFGIAIRPEEGVTAIAGKPEFMSPEQLAGADLDGRTDIYSLGLVLYELLAGFQPLRPPAKLPAEEKIAYAKRAIASGFPAPHAVYTDVPPVLSDITMKMLAADPAARFATARLAGDELEQGYLYKEGFGPTNNSFQAYLAIFDREFKSVYPDELKQLAFLTGPSGKIEIRRPILWDRYTDAGKRLVSNRKGTLLYKVLADKEKVHTPHPAP
ncbi:MAG: serine/threonine-protein kinase [Planctomycetota bacterium]